MRPLRCLVVDDEPLARERLSLLLRESGADVVGEARNGEEALKRIGELGPDVVFLDIEMPGLDGFDVVDLLDPASRPSIVFVTAFDAYAVRAFDVHAVDYLTKPVRSARLQTALTRVSDVSARSTATRRIDALLDDAASGSEIEPGLVPLDRITLKAGRKLWVVAARDIARFEADSKLTIAYPSPGGTPGDRTGLVEFTLDTLEARLPARTFVRMHRSVLVNARAIRELVPWFSGTYRVRLSDGSEVPLARRRVATVRALLGG